MTLPRYETHICLVSDQTLPNLLPVLHDDFRPERVILMVTPSMERQAARLERVLRDRGVRSERCPVEAYGYEVMRGRVFTVVAELGDGAAINLTGGTKIMALAAFDIAREFDLPAFYLDSRDQRLLLLRPQADACVLPELLKLKSALRAHGYEPTQSADPRIPPNHRPLTEQLVQQAERWRPALGTLNYLAAEAGRKNALLASLPSGRRRDELEELLRLFDSAGLLSLDAERGLLIFADEAARCYVNGGWLEEYCQGVVRKLQKEGRIFDVAANLEIVSTEGVKNELDLAFTARNRLHLLECKTANLAFRESSAAGETRAAQAGYKLDTLRDLVGGTFGKAMLVSFLKLPEVDRVRCESYGIRVVQARHLARLREEILQWIG